MKLSSALILLLLSGTSAFALTGQDGESAQVGAFSLISPSNGTVLRALQLAPQQGFGLTGMDLLGRYGLTAQDVVKELAPHLEAATLSVVDSDAQGDVVHEVYALHFGKLRLADAQLTLHHHQNRLVLLRAELPEYRLPSAPPADADFTPLEALGYPLPEGETWKVTAVLASSGGLASPAWEVIRRTESGGVETLTIDAQNGALLTTVTSAFDLARVFQKSPLDGKLVDVQLEGLPQTGYLDGKHFSVYAPREADPRAMAPDLVFDFLPDDPAEALFFDQVQAYYAATKGLSFFRDKLGFDPGAERLALRVHDEFSGKPDNAQYVPPPLGPELRIGRGGQQLQNLARDTDVVVHELAHHVVYRWLKSSTGESGVLHEGTADYFAYAVSGDPYLAESIVPGGPYLRTAAIDGSLRYDMAPPREGAHKKGQYWSAVLWDLRKALGDAKGDQLVYRALAYLGRDAGLTEAFLALLNADRDMNPRPAGDPFVGVFGQNQCGIMEAGIRRGFAQQLEIFDGSACGLNLKQLADESRAAVAGRPSTEGRKASCGLVGAERNVGPAAWAFLLAMLVPLLTRRRPRGS